MGRTKRSDTKKMGKKYTFHSRRLGCGIISCLLFLSFWAYNCGGSQFFMNKSPWAVYLQSINQLRSKLAYDAGWVLLLTCIRRKIKAKRLRNTDLAQTITFAQKQCVFARERKSVPECGKSFISENNERPLWQEDKSS